MAIKVPFYDSKVGMNPEAAGAPMSKPPDMPMESVAEAGIPGMQVAKAGDQLATVAVEVGQRLTHARNVKDFAEMDLQTRTRLDTLSKEIQQDPEATPDNWSKRFEEGAAKIKEEVRGLTGNQLVQASYDRKWGPLYFAKLQEITAKGNKQDAQLTGAAFETHLPQYTALYAQATDDLSRAQIKETVDSYILAAVKSGSITPHMGAKARVEFIPEAMKARVLGEIPGDPAGVMVRLREPEKHYPGLTPANVLSLSGTANAAMHMRQEENATAVEKLYQDKQLRPEQLKEMFNQGAIRPQTYHYYKASLDRDAAPWSGETDKDTYIKRYRQAEKGVMPLEEFFNDVRLGTLDKKDATYLFSVNRQAARGETAKDTAFTKTPYYRAALKELIFRAEKIDKSLMNLKLGKKPNMVESEAEMMLLDECRAAQAKGIPPGNWMLESARKIMEPFEVMGATGRRRPAAGGAAAAPAAGGADQKQRALEILRQRGRLPAQ